MNRASATWQWDDVRFFLAVARAGNLSGAARALDVGHVTVGRRITLLEKRLGVILLNRTPDGFATTSAGDAVLRQCIAMENAALDIERLAAGRDSLMTGSVRVTSTEALAFQVVAPAVASLRQAHPGLQVDLTVGVRSLDIARRDADLAVRFARPSTSDLVCRKLGEVGYSLYASERYLQKSETPRRGQGWPATIWSPSQVRRRRRAHSSWRVAGWRTHSPAVRQSPHPVEGRGQRRGYCRTHVLPG